MKMPQLERGQPGAWPEEPARGWGLGRQAGEGSRAKAQGMPLLGAQAMQPCMSTFWPLTPFEYLCPGGHPASESVGEGASPQPSYLHSLCVTLDEAAYLFGPRFFQRTTGANYSFFARCLC